uniref:U4/U6.U5 tri-snRNP-associated protein 1 n=1 Tax=Globodera pallida TaxID=36090 RepID=A0A183BUD5_GLOPA
MVSVIHSLKIGGRICRCLGGTAVKWPWDDLAVEGGRKRRGTKTRDRSTLTSTAQPRNTDDFSAQKKTPHPPDTITTKSIPSPALPESQSAQPTSTPRNNDKMKQKRKKVEMRNQGRFPHGSSRHKKQRTASPGDEGGDTNVESLSIEETNKLRAKLGLAPLELDDKSEPVEKEDGSGEKVFTEYGIEIVHKAAKSWAEERHGKEVKEKLDTRKKQREVYTKVLKAKRTLGEESDEEAAGTNDMTKWVEKSRKLEEEMRKAEHKAKLLDEMDEAFGIGGLIQAEQQKQKRRTTTTTSKAGASSLSGAGFVVGHSIQQFSEGRETVLILQDKEILDEAEDEVLINPNMLENERHKLNVEKRKKKDNYQPYEEEGARANVNVDLLKSLADKMKRDAEQAEDDEEEEEDQFPHVTNGGAAATSLLFIEDEAEEELNAVLAKARRLRQAELQIAAQKKNAAAAGVAVNRAMKTEQYNGVSSDEEETAAATAAMTAQERNAVVFDSTSEKYKSIGGIYGLFSASKDPVKMEPILEEEDEAATKRSSTSEQKKKAAAATAKEVRKGSTGSDTEMMVEGVDADVFDSLLRMDTTTKEEQQEEEHGSSDSQSDEDDDNPSSTATYTNILGEEKDVTKGVGAMLKLAGQKGYLESGERKLDEGKLKHLESKRFSKVEQGRYDIEDKTMRKLERMGTTGTGPTRPFPDKAEYTPKFEINYADQKGRILDPKEAFRVLSWKFHGKGPGKKQAEKHAAKVVKREKLKKMNSMDTPLGTLNKQLKKQEQLQAPYLVLSGRGDGGQPLQKE